MEFALGDGGANASAEIAAAAQYPQIRLFTVGQCFYSPVPLTSLRSIEQSWVAASPKSVARGGMFGVFSAVCWFFGRQIADANPGVPIGLISSTRGGSPIAEWVAGDQQACGKPTKQGHYYNTQIAPFATGPMALTGFAYYQAEADTKDEVSAKAYACTFPALVKGWRAAFKAPEDKDEKYFGFVQLSTWCAIPGDSVPQMREAQMAAAKLPNVGWATNADHGDGCAIHPHDKRPCGTRLGNSAVSLIYKKQVTWKSPTYESATIATSGDNTVVTVTLANAGGGLEIRPPANLHPDGVRNSSLFPNGTTCSQQNKKVPNTCAWGAVKLAGKGWLNATISVKGSTMMLAVRGTGTVVGTSYAWGAIPMMTVYEKATSLPVLGWNTTWNCSS